MLTDIRYFPNLLQKSPIIRTLNRDGSDFIAILLKFAGLYDVIAIDRYLFIYCYLQISPKDQLWLEIYSLGIEKKNIEQTKQSSRT